MRISIVIPVYNGAETAEACFAALSNQSGWQVNEDYEIIVVDDGSTDTTAAIASKFPMRLERLNTNQGRITAREVGVRAARCERILLCDIRAIADANLLQAQSLIDGPLLMVGDLGEEERAHKNAMDRVFLLLRNRYYACGAPQREEILIIDSRNFHRMPKGLTCARTEKSLFLSALPADKGKHVNDDARLLAHLVYDRGLVLKRCSAMKIEYLQRDEKSAFRPWLVHRGVMFIDFVWKSNALYPIAFLLSWLFIVIFFASTIFWTQIAFLSMASLFVALFTLCIWLAKTPRDVWLLLRVLPEIGVLFWYGVNKGIVLQLSRR